MIRESALLNCVYPLNRKEQLEEEIGRYGCMSEIPKQYSSILLCVIHLIKQFLDGKTNEDCKKVVLFESEGDSHLLSCLTQVGFETIYPMIPFLYYVDPSKHLLLADDVIVLVCGGFFSEIFFFDEEAMTCSDFLFHLSHDSIVAYFVDHIAENYQRKYGESLYNSSVLSDRIKECCEDVVSNLQKGVDYPFLVVEHKKERSKLVFSQKHLRECYRALCEQELFRLIQTYKCTTIALVGGGCVFEAMKELHDVYNILIVSEFVPLSVIFQNLERYRLDILSNYNHNNLTFLRRFLGQLMPSSSSSIITCWKDAEALYPPALLSFSDDGSFRKTLLTKRLDGDNNSSLLFSIEDVKPLHNELSCKCDATSTLTFGFFSGTTFDPFLSYSVSPDRLFCICTEGNPLSSYSTFCNGQLSRSCVVDNDFHMISIYSLLDEYSHTSIMTSPIYDQSIVIEETLSEESIRVYVNEDHPSLLMRNPLHSQSFQLISYLDRECIVDLSPDGSVRMYTKPLSPVDDLEVAEDWKEWFEERPLEDQWVHFVANSDLGDMGRMEEEFQSWYSLHHFESDPVYSTLSNQCMIYNQREEDRSESPRVFDCPGFQEYPLNSGSLLSQHKNWVVKRNRIVEGTILLYEGSMSGDKLNGKGCWYYRSFSKMYEGEFSANMWNGFGSLFYPNGTLFYKGYWRNGLMNGSGILYKPVNLQCCNSSQRKYITENVKSAHLSVSNSFYSSLGV